MLVRAQFDAGTLEKWIEQNTSDTHERYETYPSTVNGCDASIPGLPPFSMQRWNDWLSLETARSLLIVTHMSHFPCQSCTCVPCALLGPMLLAHRRVCRVFC